MRLWSPGEGSGRFQIGDVVEWKTGNHHGKMIRRGEVVGIVPPGEPATKYAPPGFLKLDRHEIRQEESYLIEAQGLKQRRDRRLRWPLYPRLIRLVRRWWEVDAGSRDKGETP